MANTVQDLESFAQLKLHRGESGLSLEECLLLWRQEQDRQEMLDDILQG